MQPRVLVVEDDKVSQKVILASLGNGFDVVISETLGEARDLLSKSKFDILILDRMLPDGDSIEICREVRAAGDESTPILFLSLKGGESDQVLGFFAGATDYVVKPLRPLEFRARVEAKLKVKGKLISVGKLSIDLEQFSVVKTDANLPSEKIDLTRLELRLLNLLSSHPDQVFSREQLLDKVWGHGVSLSDRVVDTHISHLKKKILNCGVKIEAVRGEGYRLIVTDGAGLVGKQKASA